MRQRDGKKLIIIGVLFNSLLITFNRFVRKIPDKIYIPLIILGVAAMLIGTLLLKK